MREVSGKFFFDDVQYRKVARMTTKLKIQLLNSSYSNCFHYGQIHTDSTVAIRLFACNVHCDGLGTQLPCCMTQLRTDSSQNALLLEHVSAAFFVHVHVPAGYKHDSWRNRGSLCVCLSKLTRTVAHFAVWWVRLLCRICWVFVDFC